MTLACEDANSKLVEVVTVADVDAEDHVGNSLLILELTFGHKAELSFRLWAQGLVKILKLKFRQDFEAGICSAFCWCFVEVMKLHLGQDSEARFGQDFKFKAQGFVKIRSWILSKILKLGLVKILSLSLVKFLKLKFDQDLCQKLWYELNPQVRCAFGNVFWYVLNFSYSLNSDSDASVAQNYSQASITPAMASAPGSFGSCAQRWTTP